MKNSNYIFYEKYKSYLDIDSIKISLKNNILFFDKLKIALTKELDYIRHEEINELKEHNYSKSKYKIRKNISLLSIIKSITDEKDLLLNSMSDLFIFDKCFFPNGKISKEVLLSHYLKTEVVISNLNNIIFKNYNEIANKFMEWFYL